MNKGQLFTPQKGLIYGYITPLLTIALFIVLIGISIFSLRYKSQASTASIIERDLGLLIDAFKRIDKDCRIQGFDHQITRINFLNVKSFAGSEVGDVNFAFPQQWKGPYLPTNPTIQSEEYLVVVTYKGNFITPGIGVQLPNGKTVDRSILLNKNADIEAMMKPGALFNHEGKPLAVKLDVGPSVTEQILRAQLAVDEE